MEPNPVPLRYAVLGPLPSFLTRCIVWRKSKHTNHSVSESIRAVIRRRWILFAVFICGAHGGRATAAINDIRRTVGGRELREGQKKEWIS